MKGMLALIKTNLIISKLNKIITQIIKWWKTKKNVIDYLHNILLNVYILRMRNTYMKM